MEEQTNNQEEKEKNLKKPLKNEFREEYFNYNGITKKNILLIEAQIKKTLITNIKIDHYIGEEDYFNELTFITDSSQYNYTHLRTRRLRGNKDFKEFNEYLNSLRGGLSNYSYNNNYYYYEPKKEYFEDIKTLYTEYKNKKFPIAYYSKNRNVVLSTLPIYRDSVKKEENKLLMEVIKRVCEAVIKENITITDNKELILKKTLSQFIHNSKKRLKNIEQRKAELEEKKEIAYKEYLEYTQNIEDEELLRNTLKNIILKKEEGLLKSFKELEELSFIEKTELSDEGLIIYFSNEYKLFSRDLNKELVIGRFKAILKEGNIRIINYNPIVCNGETYHSPHIKEKSVCFGEQKNTIYNFLRIGNFKRVAILINMFLNSYNPEDVYLSLDLWNKAQENGGIYEEAENDEGGEDE